MIFNDSHIQSPSHAKRDALTLPTRHKDHVKNINITSTNPHTSQNSRLVSHLRARIPNPLPLIIHDPPILQKQPEKPRFKIHIPENFVVPKRAALRNFPRLPLALRIPVAIFTRPLVPTLFILIATEPSYKIEMLVAA